MENNNSGITVAVHQPNYLPWAGYFYKMLKSDIFVFLDDVQYTKNSFINRNRIKGPQGVQWLTVPVKASNRKKINEVGFADVRWSSKHIKTLDAFYKRAPYYEIYRAKLVELLTATYWNIGQLNKALITQIAQWLNLSCQIFSSSEFAPSGISNDRLIEIVKRVSGSVYLSGHGAVKYQDERKFANEGIRLIYYDFSPPHYPQLWGEFEPGLSIVDLLFNVGDRAAEVLKSSSTLQPSNK